MSKQRVRLHLPIDETWDAGERIEVYTDFGSGSLDMTAPLLSRAVDLFPGAQAARCVGLRSVGRGRVGDNRAARPHRGIGRNIVGVTPVGTTPAYLDVEVDVPAAFGQWKFAARTLAADGTVQGGELQAISLVVSGTEPGPPTAFSFNAHDSDTDQVIFDLDWSK